MKTGKTAALLIFLCGAASLASAKPDSSTELNVQASTRPEARLGINRHFIFPFLRGEGPLTADNNIKTTLSADITPVSMNTSAEAVWTPAAFFNISAGAKAGSGWNIELFGSDIRGIGINRRGAGGEAEVKGSAFDGLLWRVKAGATFQFDLAALFPGDWNHVVFLTYHEWNYKGYTAASKGESWYYENDDGENMNGSNYYANFVLGYQMPIFLSMAAFMAEVEKYLYDTPGRELWGDELGRWTLSGILNFSITENISAALLLQFRTRRNFSNGNNDDSQYYQDRRIVESGNKRCFEWYRLALNMTWKLR
ncbi:hypothetical protein LJC14_07295 [Treponema sp. OttesenSCG-928-L16]|nr:hypothetical protein [Treponema sp. OttesenSCG-928-L16]